jgi:hypothetical protein
MHALPTNLTFRDLGYTTGRKSHTRDVPCCIAVAYGHVLLVAHGVGAPLAYAHTSDARQGCATGLYFFRQDMAGALTRAVGGNEI